MSSKLCHRFLTFVHLFWPAPSNLALNLYLSTLYNLMNVNLLFVRYFWELSFCVKTEGKSSTFWSSKNYSPFCFSPANAHTFEGMTRDESTPIESHNPFYKGEKRPNQCFFFVLFSTFVSVCYFFFNIFRLKKKENLLTCRWFIF